ncbi:unnamed protein product, partial [Linum tenue]
RGRREVAPPDRGSPCTGPERRRDAGAPASLRRSTTRSADGVDILSVSLGAPSSLMLPDFKDDTISIGAFHAVESGITVVCSAGNDGPDSSTVVNAAPWILTVAATTIDRDFQSDVVLGGGNVVKGEAINFSKLRKSHVYSLTYGKTIMRFDTSELYIRNCVPGSIDKAKVNGTIVLCENKDPDYPGFGKVLEIQYNGGVGVIFIDDLKRRVASTLKDFPAVVISSKDAAEILSYNSTKNPVATILATVATPKYKPAPEIAYFSARGPSQNSENLIKTLQPDIAAPGVNILAAWMGNDSDIAPQSKDPSMFNVISGTSMSCPNVSGVAAVVKSHNPSFGPSEIKSAIMTTASQLNNDKSPITTHFGATATPSTMVPQR